MERWFGRTGRVMVVAGGLAPWASRTVVGRCVRHLLAGGVRLLLLPRAGPRDTSGGGGLLLALAFGGLLVLALLVFALLVPSARRVVAVPVALVTVPVTVTVELPIVLVVDVDFPQERDHLLEQILRRRHHRGHLEDEIGLLHSPTETPQDVEPLVDGEIWDASP